MRKRLALLIAYLRKMNDELNIPHCIKNYGLDSYPCAQGFVPEDVFLERLPEIAKNAIGDALHRFQSQTTFPKGNGRTLEVLLLRY